MPSICSVGVLSGVLCGLWSPGGGSCSGHQGIHECAGTVKNDLSTLIMYQYTVSATDIIVLARSKIVVLILMHIFHMMAYQPTAGCPHSTECRARHSVYLWVWRYSCTQGKSSCHPTYIILEIIIISLPQYHKGTHCANIDIWIIHTCSSFIIHSFPLVPMACRRDY